MKKWIAIVSILLVSCQIYNGASRDKLIYGSSVDLSTDFGKAYSVLSTRCTACHIQFAGWSTQQDWVTNGYVIAQNLSASKVYYRLIGANLGVATEDMPQNSVLSIDELADIRRWIQNM